MKQFEIQPIAEMGQCGETVNTSVLSVSMENYQSLADWSMSVSDNV